MEKQTYTIYMIGKRAVCPNCSGMVIVQEDSEIIKCIDCKSIFKVKGGGQTERELVCIKFR